MIISLHKKVRRNKRGEDMLVDFWAILVFAIILVLFFIVFSIEKHKIENKIDEKFQNKDTNLMLQSFLRAPATGYDSTKTIADIIAEDSMINNFDRTEKLFENYFSMTLKMSNEEISDTNIRTIDRILLFVDEKNRGRIVYDKGLSRYAVRSTGTVQESPNAAETDIPGYDGAIKIILNVVTKEYLSSATTE